MVARSKTAIEAKLGRDRTFQNERNKQRRISGLCIKCGKPARKGKAQCQDCAVSEARRLMKHRNAAKAKAVEYLGGQCVDCGLRSEYADVYDFHHTVPEKKSMNIARMITSTKKWEKIREELDKCVLLCANCHRIRHAKE